MSGRAEQFDAAARLSTPPGTRCTAEQIAAARVFTADHARRHGLGADELDELLEALGIGCEVQV